METKVTNMNFKESWRSKVRLYAIKQPETSQYLQQNSGFLNKPSKGLEI